MTDETSTTSKPKNRNFLKIAIGALLVLGLIFLIFGGTKTKAEPATISGEIDFNGITPEDAKNPDLGEIKLLAKETNNENGQYENTNVVIPFEDKTPWVWKEAKTGTTYDLVAEVYYKDLLIKKSNKVTSTAPATGLMLLFNVTLDDIPEQIRPTQSPAEPTKTPELVTISGVVVVNGFIPNGSYINAYGRIAGSNAQFDLIREKIPARPSFDFSYTEAVAGRTYEVQGELYNANGVFIGQSNYITVTAPASNERWVINSTAVPPVQKATISGTIRLNGSVQQNSTILVLQRTSGQTEYAVINRYPANASTNFSWTDAAAGTTYDISAALQVNETNTASGNVQTVVAPASGVTITIDTNFNLRPPSGTPSINCGGADQTNHFNAQISMPQIDGAKKYNLEVGTAAGSNNTFNGTLEPNTSATVYVAGNSPYFARYRYTACTDCDTSNTSNWSGWSPTLGFQCP